VQRGARGLRGRGEARQRGTRAKGKEVWASGTGLKPVEMGKWGPEGQMPEGMGKWGPEGLKPEGMGKWGPEGLKPRGGKLYCRIVTAVIKGK